MGKFVIKKRINGQFMFNLLANNGLVILTSESYITKIECRGGIETVRKNSIVDARYDRRKGFNMKYYFNLKALNGKIIGTSQEYESSSGRDIGIEAVKINALTATVEDNV